MEDKRLPPSPLPLVTLLVMVEVLGVELMKADEDGVCDEREDEL